MGICYPLLKEVDLSISISQQKGYNNEYARYWTKPILEINGKHYIMCSQWFENFRTKVDDWIDKQSKITEPKFKVYIIQKQKSKICPECGNKMESEILYMTYHTGAEDIHKQLFTRRCKGCQKTYMADTLFKSYTRNKNIDNMDVEFIF